MLAEAARRDENICAAGGVDVESADAARRRMVVPAGWRTARSGFTDTSGNLVLELLPVDEELRFAASRGQEAFRVVGSVALRAFPCTCGSGSQHRSLRATSPKSRARSSRRSKSSSR
ncbi:MAG: hypothetical protein GY711_19360 [bacterium]|nr:hypothetical protein [bacterium]